MENNGYQKNLFVGLANAGKSSIIKVIQHEFKTLLDVKPTMGIDRDIFKIFRTEIILWDFGGQALYREQYFENPELNFSDVSNLIYVIDVKAPMTEALISENINYFSKLVEFTSKYTRSFDKTQFYLFFHKMDYDADFELDLVSKLQERYIREFLTILQPYNKAFRFFNTSIKEPMSILNAVADIFFSRENLSNQISEILKNFALLYKLRFCVFFTEKLFQLGGYVSERINKEEVPEILDLFFSRMESYEHDAMEISVFYRETQLFSSTFSLTTFVMNNADNGGMDNDRGARKFVILMGFKEGEALLDLENLRKEISRLSSELQKLLLSLNFEMKFK